MSTFTPEEISRFMPMILADINVPFMQAYYECLASILNAAQLSCTEANSGAIKNNTNNLKARKWSAIVADAAITQTNLAGIVITGAGTLVLIGSDDAELDLGTVSADPITILPFCPKMVKTGSTATVKAIYGV